MNYIKILGFAFLLVLASCSKDDEMPIVIPTDKGTIEDIKGFQYNYVRIGNLEWTTSNVRCGTPCYQATYEVVGWKEEVFNSREKTDIKENYMPVYGNLITLEEAEKYAPEGWRVPTDDDWKQLEMAMGMSQEDADSYGWRGTKQAFQLEDTTCIHLQLGGALIWTSSITTSVLTFTHKDEYGYYWTSTKDTTRTDSIDAVFCRKLCANKGEVERQSVRRDNRYYSARWVRDVK